MLEPVSPFDTPLPSLQNSIFPVLREDKNRSCRPSRLPDGTGPLNKVHVLAVEAPVPELRPGMGVLKLTISGPLAK